MPRLQAMRSRASGRTDSPRGSCCWHRAAFLSHSAVGFLFFSLRRNRQSHVNLNIS